MKLWEFLLCVVAVFFYKNAPLILAILIALMSACLYFALTK